MGMYTMLEFDAQLNDVGVALVTELHQTREWPEHPITKDWRKLDRASYIPFGFSCYFPEHRNSHVDGRAWAVRCSLKNYNREIQTFLDTVLPYLLQEPCTCRYRYEESRFPTVQYATPKNPFEKQEELR